MTLRFYRCNIILLIKNNNIINRDAKLCVYKKKDTSFL